MKFNVTKELTIWCDRCMQWDQQSGSKISLFIKRRKEEGWRLWEGKTVCPSCALDLESGMEWDEREVPF